jgi:AcrR family transcriptional regulator
MLGEPIRDRRSERHEATRAEIIEAAWAVAREQGVAALSLRDVARRVGMQAPSLYSYFASKNDIYDAMFAQAWSDLLEQKPAVDGLPDDPRAAMKVVAHFFFDWAVADPARYLLTSQRTIPGFEPTPAAYAPSLAALDDTKRVFDHLGIPLDAIDLYTAFIAGLVAQQVANDPGGDRWKRQVDRAMDAFCDAVLPRSSASKTPAKKKTATRGKR